MPPQSVAGCVATEDVKIVNVMQQIVVVRVESSAHFTEHGQTVRDTNYNLNTDPHK